MARRLPGARKPLAPQARAQTSSKTFPAPTGGWWTSKPLVQDGPATARILDNWFPTREGIRCRGGSILHATVHATNPVVEMWTYEGATQRLFASTAGAIFDVTTPADPTVIPASAVSGQTSGYYSTQMFSTVGGIFQYVVNGTDLAQLFNGATWTQITGVSTPAITGVVTSQLQSVWAHANRLWFAEKGTMRAWYLPVDSVGGAAVGFNLSGVFRKGGTLLFGTTWSLDSGDGLDDKCVFVSTRGEAVIYAGTDPSSASTWAIEGVYDLAGDPLGKNSFFHIGGEPYFLTSRGIVPITEAIRRDVSQLQLGALTVPISDEWIRQGEERSASPWPCFVWPWAQMLVVGLPVVDPNDDAYCYVSNTETRAWCRFVGLDVNAGAAYSYFGYFGTSAGKIYQMDVGGKDDTLPYTCAVALHFDHLELPNFEKTVHQARALFRTGNTLIPKLSASINYAIQLPAAPSSPPEFSAGDVWDSAIWDTSVWDAGLLTTNTATTRWQSIGKTGYAHAIQLQITWGTVSEPNTELLSIDVNYEPGAMVV
jgi:hypothetical protein